VTPTCLRCGGPTVALFYSRACAADCQDAPPGPLAWAVWRDGWESPVPLYKNREKAAEIRKLVGGRVVEVVGIEGPAEGPEWIPGHYSTRFEYMLVPDGEDPEYEIPAAWVRL
jgi:hypothetical protein